MRQYCNEVPGPKMANMVEGGSTPFLSPPELEAIGYKIIIYPISLMLAGMKFVRLVQLLQDVHLFSFYTLFMML